MRSLTIYNFTEFYRGCRLWDNVEMSYVREIGYPCVSCVSQIHLAQKRDAEHVNDEDVKSSETEVKTQQ